MKTKIELVGGVTVAQYCANHAMHEICGKGSDPLWLFQNISFDDGALKEVGSPVAIEIVGIVISPVTQHMFKARITVTVLKNDRFEGHKIVCEVDDLRSTRHLSSVRWYRFHQNPFGGVSQVSKEFSCGADPGLCR